MEPDWLKHFPQADKSALQALLAEKAAWVGQEKKGFLRYRKPLETVAHIRAQHCDFSSEMVSIGQAGELDAAGQKLIRQTLEAFIPWRKGPFSVFGVEVDAEWRSERKWARLLPELPDLAGKTVADIGCNNGYYMFRMAAHRPACVLGLEPFVQHHYAFRLLNGLAGQPNLHSELLGIEHLPLFPSCFDVIFCMGILYHRSSPIEALKSVWTALKPGGTLLLESQIIPGAEPVALFPEKSYAKAPGVWFVPTASCLVAWLKRVGFQQVRLFCRHTMDSREQRRTAWMRYESYADFVDRHDLSRTVEGLPAPWRAFFTAQRP